ncbi:amylosucrase [Planctomicrobium piriforme]|uniref:Amylosucrase/maltose alpha-D-glucosyltransferase/ alpha-amylase n=1 Tax=Planctomicrobium piriforme TaxID=1576369 RepID=A0A1I3D7A5_9PLAN|nr:amylosucrase/maltose alpha-D-glucosyltransferase/ alpha-amylase [Planctomicrobium piriforme]
MQQRTIEENPARESKTLERLLPRLEERFASQIDPPQWDAFTRRVRREFPSLFRRLLTLYGTQYDFFYHLENILASATQMWIDRPNELKALDAMREADPDWFMSNRMVGAMCYADLFAGGLQGLREKIPYLKELGITYLHLMPPFKVPNGDNDGGYAVSSYREIQPELGSMDDLAQLATELRHHGISLVIDFVFNHTSDEHKWAGRALAGDQEYQDFYRMFPDRSMPDAYEQALPEIFPDEHPGSFTYRSRISKWVWTTFHNYQWDLNYENPAVFNHMLEELLFLANQGVEILRLDAVAFLWKRLGTDCQNLPEAHWIIQAFNSLVRIAAPAMLFKSEAIVHPDEVRKYISEEECQLSYNPQLMAVLWNSLATREVKLLKSAMQRRFHIPPECDWVNYVRCHDDIGWAFSNDDVEIAGFDPRDHRRFLTKFFTGQFPGSFARGAPFQEDRKTGDARVSGTCASLCGLEQALEEHDEHKIDLAIGRILLIHGVIMTIGGIPLLYLGDEIAMLNDQEYVNVPDKLGDSRWLHRGRFDWDRAALRNDATTVPGRVHQGLLRLIQLRHQNLAFSKAETEFIDTGNTHVLGYFRNNNEYSVLCLANVSEEPQTLEGRHLRLLGLRKTVVDMVSGHFITAMQEMQLQPYQFAVLSRPR